MEILFVFAAVCLGAWALAEGLRVRFAAMSGWIAGAVILGLGFIACGGARAQAVVHAVTGTVTAASAGGDTFTLKAGNGTTMRFKALTSADKQVSLDKKLTGLESPAAGLKKVGAQVLVFFYGYDSVLTAVGEEMLGETPMTRVVGIVGDFDKHKHTMKLKGVDAGAVVEMSDKTVVDTPGGVVEGLRYKPNKGERVAVISSGGSAGTTVWLVSATGPNASL